MTLSAGRRSMKREREIKGRRANLVPLHRSPASFSSPDARSVFGWLIQFPISNMFAFSLFSLTVLAAAGHVQAHVCKLFSFFFFFLTPEFIPSQRSTTRACMDSTLPQTLSLTTTGRSHPSPTCPLTNGGSTAISITHPTRASSSSSLLVNRPPQSSRATRVPPPSSILQKAGTSDRETTLVPTPLWLPFTVGLFFLIHARA